MRPGHRGARRLRPPAAQRREARGPATQRRRRLRAARPPAPGAAERSVRAIGAGAWTPHPRATGRRRPCATRARRPPRGGWPPRATACRAACVRGEPRGRRRAPRPPSRRAARWAARRVLPAPGSVLPVAPASEPGRREPEPRQQGRPWPVRQQEAQAPPRQVGRPRQVGPRQVGPRQVGPRQAPQPQAGSRQVGPAPPGLRARAGGSRADRGSPGRSTRCGFRGGRTAPRTRAFRSGRPSRGARLRRGARLARPAPFRAASS